MSNNSKMGKAIKTQLSEDERGAFKCGRSTIVLLSPSFLGAKILDYSSLLTRAHSTINCQSYWWIQDLRATGCAWGWILWYLRSGKNTHRKSHATKWSKVNSLIALAYNWSISSQCLNGNQRTFMMLKSSRRSSVIVEDSVWSCCLSWHERFPLSPLPCKFSEMDSRRWSELYNDISQK
jgi:hypothetical protein